VEVDVDWFTAADDLTEDLKLEGGSNTSQQAGHISSQQFSSGTFYRYASLNLRQLAENMSAERKDALNVGAHLVYLLATVVPSGKQHSFGAFNPADYVVCNFSTIPISAQTAFEEPVKADRQNGGYLKPSIAAFEDYWEKVHNAYAVNGKQAAFSLWGTKLSPHMKTIEELKDWVRKEGV
jgi:CRISPR system Cascade subunit CasC